MACLDATEWEVACQEEMHTFKCMGVYKVVLQLCGKNIVGSKWVFCIKHGPEGTIQKYKACVVT